MALPQLPIHTVMSPSSAQRHWLFPYAVSCTSSYSAPCSCANSYDDASCNGLIYQPSSWLNPLLCCMVVSQSHRCCSGQGSSCLERAKLHFSSSYSVWNYASNDVTFWSSFPIKFHKPARRYSNTGSVRSDRTHALEHRLRAAFHAREKQLRFVWRCGVVVLLQR